MSRRYRVAGLGLCASAFAMLATMPAAIAQQAPASSTEVAQAAPAQAIGLDEIVVTANRRQSNLQETPVAVSAFTPAMFDAAPPKDLGDIAAYVPNFSAARVTGFNAASFAMRGVGQVDIIVYSEAPVGVMLDDFVMPSVQSQLLDTFDVERVEVLRGPQGTLFGKNTTGGVVTVYTKKPSLTDQAGEVQFTAGSFGTRAAKASVNLPLVEDKLGVRLVAAYNKSDGYYKNGACYGPVPGSNARGCGDGSKLGGEDIFNGRAKVLWKPVENVEALFQVERVRDNSDSVPVVNTTPSDSRWAFYNLGFSQDAGDPLDHAGITNRDDSLLNMSDGHQVDVDGYYSTINWEADKVTLTSVTGWRKQYSQLPSTYTGEVGPISLFDANRTDLRKTFQQEFRMASNWDGPVQMVAGGFYQKNDVNFCVAQILGFLDLFGTTLPFGTFNNNPQVLCNQERQKAYAAYGDVTWEVNDKLTLIGGARWTKEKKAWAGRNQVFVQALSGTFDPNFTWNKLGKLLNAGDFNKYPTGVVRDSETWSEPTWRASASYKVTDDLMAYATYSRGFRSGAYNDQTGTTGVAIPALAARPTNPELADSYEAGIKADFLDNRARLNATAFYVNYKDMQRGLVATLTNSFGQQVQETRFFNAGEATVKGLELEGSILPTEGLEIRGVLGYLDAKYDKFEADTDFDGDIDIDFSNRPLNRAPKWQWTLDATYTMDLADKGEILFNGAIQFEDENGYVYSDVSPEFDSKLVKKTLLNAAITWHDADGRYTVQAVGRNLTDKRYNTATNVVGSLWTFSTYGPPRYYGLTVGAKF
jgi:iron complex outermembrane receptor protein